MARPRIVFVEHQPSCPPALFAGWAGDLGAETSVCRPYAGDDLPAATGHALVILGGSMGANDDLPWFAPLASLIRDAHQAGTPTLGICLGHQLIARALGGRVTTNPAGIQLGVRDVGWTDEARQDVLFRRLAGEPARAVHWNDDVVSSVPAGSVVLARSEGAVQALRHGSAMWGVQWHPEADDAVVGRWAALDEPRLLAQGLDAAAAAAAVAAERTTLDDGAHRLVAGFVELVRQSDGPAATGQERWHDDAMVHERAGQVALPEDLIDVDALIGAYYDLVPDPANIDQRVVFGTSGHRGSSLKTSFNDLHIAATTQAIVEYRASQGIDGPLFIGKDTHGLSLPAWKTALEVLVANGVDVRAEREDEYTPTPAVSRAIIVHNRDHTGPRADGIVVTPSHNPPTDGGFKYNPPHGGPADTDATSVIAARANELMGAPEGIKRDKPYDELADGIQRHDYRSAYCEDLKNAIDLEAIRQARVHIGADPMGGASVQYWQYISENLGIDLTVINPLVDPTWRFMTLDWDGKIRMDCSSPNAMASLIKNKDAYDISTGNDADADRHGIVTPDHGLMNPNHFLAVAIWYLYNHRPGWKADAGVGKTLVSSSFIDKVAADLGRTLVEVPVGFKWFVPGLMSGDIGFGGEESAGASFLTLDGQTWTTDKDGILLCLLASEIKAVTGKSPSQIYAEMEAKYGTSAYARVDAPANREQKAKLAKLSPGDVTATELAGEPIVAKLTNAPGNGAPIGGLKVTTEHAWFAARPSGTEDVYKIYAESLLGPEHLARVQAEARDVVSAALG